MPFYGQIGYRADRLDGGISQEFQQRCAAAAIAKVCLAYLLQFEDNIFTWDMMEHFPFAKYSARYWMLNAAKAEDKEDVTLQLIEQLFCFSKSAYKVCYILYQPDVPWKAVPHNNQKRIAPALYHAVLGGLLYTAKYLLNRGADVNVQGGFYGNALQAASSKGYEQIMRLLVGKGADINTHGGEYGNALQAASSQGHEHILELLVEKGAWRTV